jgi:Icc protein
MNAQVFAIEDRGVQLHWSELAPGHHEIAVGDQVVALEHGGGPGAVVVNGLNPSCSYLASIDGREVDRFTTLPSPLGPELMRVATVSDLHLGELAFGRLPRIRQGPGTESYTISCTRAALAEMVEWGAQLIVLKGDLSHTSNRWQFEVLAGLLAEVPVPYVVMPGNHDGGNHSHDDVASILASHGIEVATGTTVGDHAGFRVITANTVLSGRGHGSLTAQLEEVTNQLASAPGAALLLMHHQFQRTPLPTYWPVGILGAQATRALDALAAANPDTLVSSGHTHRHRRHSHGPVVMTEVGSAIHYPGTWAGYVAHTGGIRQVVRRVAAPDAIDWTERTRAMLCGVWGRWSVGSLDDRCFTHAWSPARLETMARR